MRRRNSLVMLGVMLLLFGGCVPFGGFRVCLSDKDVESSFAYRVGERYRFLVDAFAVWDWVYKTHYAVVPHAYSCQGELYAVPNTVEEWESWKVEWERMGRPTGTFNNPSTNDFHKIKFLIPRGTVCEVVRRNVCYYWSWWYGFGTYPSVMSRCEVGGETVEVALNCLTSYKTDRPISRFLEPIPKREE